MKPFKHKFKKSAIERAEKHIMRLLEESKLIRKGDRLDATSDADYAQAYGIFQGLAFAAGYESPGDETDENSPMYWFESLFERANDVAKTHDAG